MSDLTIEIQVEGAQQLIDRLDAATAAQTLGRALVESQHLIQERLQHYPPPPAGSTYVRTGNLGRGWQTPAPEGMTAQITNMVEYAPLVQGSPLLGDPHQTRQHEATGWQTDVQVAEESVPEIERIFTETIQEALG